MLSAAGAGCMPATILPGVVILFAGNDRQAWRRLLWHNHMVWKCDWRRGHNTLKRHTLWKCGWCRGHNTLKRHVAWSQGHKHRAFRSGYSSLIHVTNVQYRTWSECVIFLFVPSMGPPCSKQPPMFGENAEAELLKPLIEK
mmetsp:Transcript_59631/g.134531  ORF Transcript_59631/g.134531 Transcript_59631/m.134531 type:complete len:141 (+) Transcript_59631:2391-2813(+)